MHFRNLKALIIVLYVLLSSTSCSSQDQLGSNGIPTVTECYKEIEKTFWANPTCIAQDQVVDSFATYTIIIDAKLNGDGYVMATSIGDVPGLSADYLQYFLDNNQWVALLRKQPILNCVADRNQDTRIHLTFHMIGENYQVKASERGYSQMSGDLYFSVLCGHND